MGDRAGGIPFLEERSRGAGLGKSGVGIQLQGSFKSEFGIRRSLSEKQRFTDPFEKITIVSELLLDFRQHAVALNYAWRRVALHADIDVSDSEIALLQIRRRFAPRGDR